MTKVKWNINRISALGMASALVGAMTFAPAAAAAAAVTREAGRISHQRVINRAAVENLQRWVSAGHADWCRDARLVAAEELRRLAADFSGGEFELNEVSADPGANGGNRVTFEWAPPDGRAVYRVTVERFQWLLPLSKDTESIVWVPTSTEISTHE